MKEEDIHQDLLSLKNHRKGGEYKKENEKYFDNQSENSPPKHNDKKLRGGLTWAAEDENDFFNKSVEKRSPVSSEANILIKKAKDLGSVKLKMKEIAEEIFQNRQDSYENLSKKPHRGSSIELEASGGGDNNLESTKAIKHIQIVEDNNQKFTKETFMFDLKEKDAISNLSPMRSPDFSSAKRFILNKDSNVDEGSVGSKYSNTDRNNKKENSIESENVTPNRISIKTTDDKYRLRLPISGSLLNSGIDPEIKKSAREISLGISEKDISKYKKEKEREYTKSKKDIEVIERLKKEVEKSNTTPSKSISPSIRNIEPITSTDRYITDHFVHTNEEMKDQSKPLIEDFNIFTHSPGQKATLDMIIPSEKNHEYQNNDINQMNERQTQDKLNLSKPTSNNKLPQKNMVTTSISSLQNLNQKSPHFTEIPLLSRLNLSTFTNKQVYNPNNNHFKPLQPSSQATGMRFDSISSSKPVLKVEERLGDSGSNDGKVSISMSIHSWNKLLKLYGGVKNKGVKRNEHIDIDDMIHTIDSEYRCMVDKNGKLEDINKLLNEDNSKMKERVDIIEKEVQMSLQKVQRKQKQVAPKPSDRSYNSRDRYMVNKRSNSSYTGGYVQRDDSSTHYVY